MFNLLKRRKIKYSFYGNCQLKAISEILAASTEFSERFEYIPIKPVYLLEKEDLEQVGQIFKNIDLLIYQGVGSTFKNGPEFGSKSILKFTKKKCKKILIPSLFFNTYFPDFHEVATKDYGLIMTPLMGSFHDVNILNGFVAGISADEFTSIYTSDDYYSKSYCEESAFKSFDGLKKREISNHVDIPISDFIQQNYQKVKLFNCQNHPKPMLIQYVIDNILSMLKLKFKVIAGKTEMDYIESAVHPNIHKNLNMLFDNKIEFLTSVGPVDNYKRLIELFFDEYKKIDLKTLKAGVENEEAIKTNFKRLGI